MLWMFGWLTDSLTGRTRVLTTRGSASTPKARIYLSTIRKLGEPAEHQGFHSSTSGACYLSMSGPRWFTKLNSARLCAQHLKRHPAFRRLRFFFQPLHCSTSASRYEESSATVCQLGRPFLSAKSQIFLYFEFKIIEIVRAYVSDTAVLVLPGLFRADESSSNI